MRTALSTVNLVIGGLVVITVGLLALVGIIAVNDSPSQVPEALWALVGVPIGALGSMLARTSVAEPPAPVQVPQAAAPVPTAEHYHA